MRMKKSLASNHVEVAQSAMLTLGGEDFGKGCSISHENPSNVTEYHNDPLADINSSQTQA